VSVSLFEANFFERKIKEKKDMIYFELITEEYYKGGVNYNK